MSELVKPTLVWDVDDVKARTREAVVASANRAFGLRLTNADYSENFPAMTRRSREAVSNWWLGFCEVELRGLEPVSGIPGVVGRLSLYFNHEQLTSRRSELRAVTQEWTRQHYAGHMAALHMMDIDWDGDPAAHLVTKADRFNAIAGAVCLIDDQPKHCLPVAAGGHWAIQFNEGNRMPVPTDVPPTYAVARCAGELEDVIMNKLLPA